ALIALQCAKNAWPFNMVSDEDYKLEVEMLWAGTRIPHPMTVSCDVNKLYLQMSQHVKEYFMVSDLFY
ncbi:hypothetical protein BDQ12DRAFT_610788, partial [Crucibulum laeve]